MNFPIIELLRLGKRIDREHFWIIPVIIIGLLALSFFFEKEPEESKPQKNPTK